MRLAAAVRLLSRVLAYGTSEGVTKAWDTRGRSNHDEYVHGVHVGIFDRPEQPNQHAHSTKKFFHQPPATLAERERLIRLFKDAYLIGRQKIDLKNVVPMQGTVVQSRFNRYLQGLKDNPELFNSKIPTVFRHGGKDFVIDGHHRLASAVQSGKTSDDALVFSSHQTTGIA